MPTIDELEEQLKWKTRSISLMLEMDRIRDQAKDEHELTSSIVGRLTEIIEADLGLLYLGDNDTGELQPRTILDRAKLYSAPMADSLRAIAVATTSLPTAEHRVSELKSTPESTGQCIAFSLRMDHGSLGAFLLVKMGRSFSDFEQELLRHAITQVDSALEHSRTVRELRRQNKEIEMIFRIDRIRDRNDDLQSMLDEVLPEICRSIEAQTGYIMLFDISGKELELRAATDYDLLALGDPDSPIHQVTREAIETARAIERTFPQGNIRSIIGQPLMLRDKLIGVLGVINRKGRAGFTRADIETLHAISSQIDSAIFEGLESQRLRDAFGKCVGPQVMNRLLATGDRDLLTGDRVPITTLFSDIRGFTNMSEQLQPELLQGVLNDHLSTLTAVVLRHEGTLDKYIGDAIMCFFNAPERQSDHALRAVRVALEMQRAHQEVIQRWEGKVALPPIGIGVSTGVTMVGNFGSVKRLEYTAIGHDVNLAARLCEAAGGNEILISESTYKQTAGRVVAEERQPRGLKGIASAVRNWNVQGLQ